MRRGAEVTAPRRRPGPRLRLSLLLGALLVAIVSATGAWGYLVNADLERTRGTLASTGTDRDTAKTSLTAVEATLASTRAELDSQQKQLADTDGRIPKLNDQIARRSACIAAQSGNVAEMRRILDLQRANFARTTTTSPWGKADAAVSAAYHAALSDLEQAYVNAAAHRFSTANVWLSRANSQVGIGNRQLAVAGKQVEAMNAATKVINDALDAFAKKLSDTEATCDVAAT